MQQSCPHHSCTVFSILNLLSSDIKFNALGWFKTLQRIHFGTKPRVFSWCAVGFSRDLKDTCLISLFITEFSISKVSRRNILGFGDTVWYNNKVKQSIFKHSHYFWAHKPVNKYKTDFLNAKFAFIMKRGDTLVKCLHHQSRWENNTQ